MTKTAKSFRLSSEAIEHLDAVQSITGSTQAAILEQALAVYKTLFEKDRELVEDIVKSRSQTREE